jgi:putative tryptophan/tyrosine transport system substrate-binding protein
MLGGAAAWPFAAGAQQTDRVRRVGALWALAANDPGGFWGFPGGATATWLDRRPQRADRQPLGLGDDADGFRKIAKELVALAPDVILATGSIAMGPLQQLTHTVPVVFVLVTDPVGAGYVESLAHPGGNATGFTTFEFALGAKWLELLKEIVLGLKRVAVLRDLAEIGQPDLLWRTTLPLDGAMIRQPKDAPMDESAMARDLSLRLPFSNLAR